MRTTKPTDVEATEGAASHPISRPLSQCPGCGSHALDHVVERDGFSVHFLCRDCSRCWHVELGFVRRVSPATCLGCPDHHRCEAAYLVDHPEGVT